jgi:hypothetical protein
LLFFCGKWGAHHRRACSIIRAHMRQGRSTSGSALSVAAHC